MSDKVHIIDDDLTEQEFEEMLDKLELELQEDERAFVAAEKGYRGTSGHEGVLKVRLIEFILNNKG